jgi:hypothetical protein
VRPDTELEDNLRKRAIMKTGVPPETIDAAYQPELATSVVTNNILLSKRVMQIQDEFHPQLAAHMRQHALNSQELMEDLKDILRENFKKLNITADDKDDAKSTDRITNGYVSNGVPIVSESGGMKRNKGRGTKKELSEDQKEFIIQQVVLEFVMNVTVTLPRPNSSTLENQLTALKAYSEALDIAIEAWISEKFFTSDTGGDVAAQVGTMKEVAKSYYLRQWMSENGMLTELAQLTTTNEDGKPLVDVFKIQAEHIEMLEKSFGEFFKNLQPVTNRINTAFQKTLDKSNTQASSGGGGFDDNLGGDNGQNGDQNGGFDNGSTFDLNAEPGQEDQTQDQTQTGEETPAPAAGAETPDTTDNVDTNATPPQANANPEEEDQNEDQDQNKKS